MARVEDLARLAEEAYDAVYEPERWELWADRVRDVFDGRAMSFHVIDRQQGVIRQRILGHDSARIVERYIDECIGDIDPQIDYVSHLQRSQVYTDLDHLDLSQTRTQDYLRWQTSVGNVRHYLSGVSILGKGRYVGGVSVHRKTDDGVTPDENRRLMETLLPHLERSLELGLLHGEKLASAYWDGLLTDRAEPAVLLDERGQLLRAVPAAETILRAGDGLDVQAGRLGAQDPASQDRLALLLGRVLARQFPEGGTVPIRRRSGRASYLVNAIPLPRPIRMFAPCEAAALLTLIDPAVSRSVGVERWQGAFGLGAREAEMAALLMQGHSVDSAAFSMEIANPTARIHLRRILAKTNCSRQADMVRLLSRF